MAKRMTFTSRVMLEAALEIMEQNGTTLTRLPSRGRAMLYKMPDGSTVRVRTTNDRVLIAEAESSDRNAKLKTEGTDYLLIAMPAKERPAHPAHIVAYLVPTQVADEALRTTFAKWLDTGSEKKGDNRVWVITFDEDKQYWGGYAKKWKKYKLPGEVAADRAAVATDIATPGKSLPLVAGRTIAEVRAGAARAIADIAGVPPEAVTIDIHIRD